jgi:hypothetical protein
MYDWLVQLTGHEVTAASGAVAALAIVGGYLGVRSANRNAVRIAREERSSRREDEANALIRATYARSLAALNVLAVASMEYSKATSKMRSVDIPNKELQEEYDAARAKCSVSEVSAHNVGAEIDLIAPPEICKLEAEAHDKATTCEPDTQNEFLHARTRLRIAMRNDLQNLDIQEDSELSQLAESELVTKTLRNSGKHILGR